MTEVLNGAGGAKILGVPDIYIDRIDQWRFSNVRRYTRSILIEATSPTVSGLYVFLIIVMGVEALLL
jgi:hypothetical protein